MYFLALCFKPNFCTILGATESGKSTMLKQIRLIHKSDFSLEERLMFKPIIHANAIQSMSIILHAVERMSTNAQHMLKCFHYDGDISFSRH